MWKRGESRCALPDKPIPGDWISSTLLEFVSFFDFATDSWPVISIWLVVNDFPSAVAAWCEKFEFYCRCFSWIFFLWCSRVSWFYNSSAFYIFLSWFASIFCVSLRRLGTINWVFWSAELSFNVLIFGYKSQASKSEVALRLSEYVAYIISLPFCSWS